MSLLVFGGTGMLGRQIVQQALEKGFKVRCVVRNKRSAMFLQEWGAELVYGDLTIPETLPLAFQGISAVIDAATTRPEDSDQTIDVDWYGKLALIEIAKQVKIKRFIFISILNAHKYPSINLMQQKAKIETVLQNSGLPYTIFQGAAFYQGLVGQYILPILDGQTIWRTTQSLTLPYIDSQDAAKLCVKALSLPATEFQSFALVGPKAYTPDSLIQLCESFSGQKAVVKTVPIFILWGLRHFFGFFESTYKISDRLAFVELAEGIPFEQVNQYIRKNENFFSFDEEDKLMDLELYVKFFHELMVSLLRNFRAKVQKKKWLFF